MNKGFRYYFSKSWNLSFYSFRRSSFKTKLLLGLYALASFVGKIIFFFRPFFVIADNNMANMINDARKISFEKMFQGVSKKKYIDLLFSYFLMDILLLMIAAICVGLPLYIFYFTYHSIPSIVTLSVFSAIALVGTYFILLNITPIGYISQKNSSLEFSDLAHNAKYSVKKNRGTIFLIFLVPMLILLGSLAIIYISFWATATYGKLQTDLLAAIMIGLFVIFVVLWFLFLSPVLMTMKTSLYLLFNDVCLLTKPIVVKPVSGSSISYEPLFEEKEEDIIKMDLNNKEEK